MNRRKKVGLALGAGGMRGMAHIGVMQVLDECGVPIDMVAGASVGAFMGAAYAADMDLYYMAECARYLTTRDVLDVPIPFRDGYLSGRKMESICRIVTDDREFSQTRIPFWCSALDLESGRLRYFHRGKLAQAVRASVAIPGVFRPSRIDGRWYIDAGMLESVPSAILRENGADVVIAVDLYGDPPYPTEHLSPRTILYRSAEMMRDEIKRLRPTRADVTIRPDVSYIRQLRPEGAIGGIRTGRLAALDALPEIHSILRR